MLPPSGLDEILKAFGDPYSPDFERKNIVRFDLPYPLVFGTAMCYQARAHKLAVPAFLAVFSDLKGAGLIERATQYAGICAHRDIRAHPGFTSMHAWGIAIDLNSEENPLGRPSRQDPAVVAIFKQHGFTWGGDFKSRLDPMHFQFATNY